jgi:hypothetical protein
MYPQSGDCYDPAMKIGIGAHYFQTGGPSISFLYSCSLLTFKTAMGEYNGQVFRITITAANDYATRAQHNNV